MVLAGKQLKLHYEKDKSDHIYLQSVCIHLSTIIFTKIVRSDYFGTMDHCNICSTRFYCSSVEIPICTACVTSNGTNIATAKNCDDTAARPMLYTLRDNFEHATYVNFIQDVHQRKTERLLDTAKYNCFV